MNPNIKKFEKSLAFFMDGLKLYAEAHKGEYESLIGEDYVLGKEWESILEGVRGLLNGELGRFDGGTLDAQLNNLKRQNGFEGK